MNDGKWRALCSGAVVSRTLVLTAAHCLTDEDDHHGIVPYVGRLAFVPGQTWRDPSSADPNDIRAPYGAWERAAGGRPPRIATREAPTGD